MRVSLNDAIFDKLETTARKNGFPTVGAFIEAHSEMLAGLDKTKPTITLSLDNISKLSAAMGGKLLRTADDIVKLLIDNFTLSVNGVTVQLDPEDANALEAQFASTQYSDKADYLRDSVKEALSVYLYGSTRGILQY